MKAAASDPSSPPVSRPEHAGSYLLQRNIEAIAKIEAAVIGERSRGERWVRALIRQVGRPRSVLLHIGFFSGWMLWNAGLVHAKAIFDPYPFNLLALVTGLEAILLGLLILASQNRLQHEADRRSHLHLQINMMTEIEGTKVLQMLDRLCDHFGVKAGSNEALDELTKETDPGKLVERIKSSMPAEE